MSISSVDRRMALNSSPFALHTTSFARRHHHMPSMCREISGAHHASRRSDRFVFKVGRSKRGSQQVDLFCDSEASPRFLSHRFDATFSIAPLLAISKASSLRACQISTVYALDQLVEALTTKPTNTKTHSPRDERKKRLQLQQCSKHTLLFLGQRGSGGRRFGCSF